jgi:transposase
MIGSALVRRQKERKGQLWVSAEQLPRSIGHAFYDTLNRLLLESGFDRFAE